jgi:hypothetical protein
MAAPDLPPWGDEEGFARLRAAAELRHNRLRQRPEMRMARIPFPPDWDAKDARQYLEDYAWFLAEIYPGAWSQATPELRKEIEEERDLLLPFLRRLEGEPDSHLAEEGAP